MSWASANTSRYPYRTFAAWSPRPSSSSALAISSGSTADSHTSANCSQSAVTVRGAWARPLATVSPGSLPLIRGS